MAVTLGKSPKKQKTFQTLSKGKSSQQIYGSMRENGMWKIRYNECLMENIKILTCMKFKRLQWAGHVQRFPLDCVPKKAMKPEFTGNRPVETLIFKWEEGVKEVATRIL